MISLDVITNYLKKGEGNFSSEEIHAIRSFLYFLADLEIEENLKQINQDGSVK